MKKHIIFLVFFILLFSLVTLSAQLVSGLFLTSTYIPDLNEAWKSSEILPKEVEIYSVGRSVLFNLISVTLSAIVAYLIALKFKKVLGTKSE